MSYDSTYEEVVDNILDQIVHDIAHHTSDIFNPERVTYGFWKGWKYDKYPNVQVRWLRDNVGLATRSEEGHTFYFQVLVTVAGTGEPEADQKEQIRVIGSIYNAIRTDNTLGDFADWAICRSVDVTFRRSESYIFFDSIILVEVHVTW